jgi:hypothetical protein
MIYIIAIIVGIIVFNLVMFLTIKKIYWPIQQAIGLLFFIIVAVIEYIQGGY